ncbi:MAG: flagellar biosynthetic protein FliO [Bacillota bacterium]|nr:flagellar biosynthetic protein FliO [Bacillota bacterium]
MKFAVIIKASKFLVSSLILYTITLPVRATALPNLDYQDPGPLAPPQMGTLLLRLIISLLVVIGLALIVIKFIQRRPFIPRPSHWIRILDQVAIGPNRGLLLAEIAGRIYVLALTEHSITKLLEIEDPSYITSLLEEEDALAGLPLPGKKMWRPFWVKTFQNILLTNKERLSRRVFDDQEGE